jgi:hypothetical protein
LRFMRISRGKGGVNGMVRINTSFPEKGAKWDVESSGANYLQRARRR